jgi:2-C-methyl-D-erythritol 4-phosphate cytidylyltransferase
MGSDVPKQYLSLNGRAVIEHTLQKVLDNSYIDGVCLAISPTDDYWGKTATASNSKIVTVEGGAERCHSVLNALKVLQEKAAPEDWVLVHDAARPCLRQDDLNLLIESLEDHPVGGLLGVPVRDTMKRTDSAGATTETVARDDLWHGYTPQMFRLGTLQTALQSALGKDLMVTDEASAIELAGMQPQMIEGHDDNIKITRPEDLALASFYLDQQRGQE